MAGGYSVAKTRMDLVGDCYNGADPSVPTIYAFSRSKTISGYNVGAGVEHALGYGLVDPRVRLGQGVA